MDEKYGVPRDIYAKVKIIGLLMIDIVFVGGFSYKPMATITSLYHLNPVDVPLFSFTNQRWEEELAKYVSLF